MSLALDRVTINADIYLQEVADMNKNDYREMREEIKTAISEALDLFHVRAIKPIEDGLAKRIDAIEQTQSQCPARKSAMGLQAIIARGMNLLIIGGLVYLIRLIMRPEVWEFLRMVASIQ